MLLPIEGEIRWRLWCIPIIKKVVRIVFDNDEVVFTCEMEDFEASGIRGRDTSWVGAKLTQRTELATAYADSVAKGTRLTGTVYKAFGNGFPLAGSHVPSILSRSEALIPSSSESTSARDNGSTSTPRSKSLVSDSAQILKPVVDRLVSLIARDAMDGAEVWKTVAFVVLDSLIRLSQSEQQPFIFTALSRPGFLSGFVQGLRESDLRLQEILKPDPGKTFFASEWVTHFS